MSDNRLTFEEVTELFGGTIPMEALVILHNAPGHKTVEEVRDEITNLALKWHRRDPAAVVPSAFDQTMHPSEREIAQRTIAQLTADRAALRLALQRIADGRGVCGMCGTWAVGEGGGVTACDCAYPHWTSPDPAEVASAALSSTKDQNTAPHTAPV